MNKKTVQKELQYEIENKILKCTLDKLNLSINFQDMEAKSREAFVPPKPNEFERAALILIFLAAVRGMKSLLKTGSGSVRLRVGGAIP